MFPGAWCGQMGLSGLVLMGIFWAAFLGLVLWASSQLFAPARGDNGLREAADDLDLRLARGQMGPSEIRARREARPAPPDIAERGAHEPPRSPDGWR